MYIQLSKRQIPLFYLDAKLYNILLVTCVYWNQKKSTVANPQWIRIRAFA